MQVLDYSAGFSLGGGGVGGAGGGAHPGGGHDLWADSVLGLGEAQADTDLRSIREQETEVILAFTLLVTILLTFVGSDQTFTFRYLKNILTISAFGFLLTCSILRAMDSAGLRGQVVVYLFDTFRKKMVLADRSSN